jgi:hypothetical protein
MKPTSLFVAVMLLVTTSVFADAKADARAEIARQVKLLKKGDVTALKARFTARQKERITAKNVNKAQQELAQYTLDDLVDSVSEGEYGGQKTIKIMMKNGRTLTTLVEENGQWYADTIWFR